MQGNAISALKENEKKNNITNDNSVDQIVKKEPHPAKLMREELVKEYDIKFGTNATRTGVFRSKNTRVEMQVKKPEIEHQLLKE